MAPVLASLAGLAARVSEAAVCAPVAVVHGPRAIAGATIAILRAHGVRSDPALCPQGIVHATLLLPNPGSTQYSLRIRDPFGRETERSVSDAETAATLIETWAMSEDADLLVPRPGRDAELPREAVLLGAPAAGEAPLWRVGAALEFAGGSDGSFWYGFSTSFCRRVGVTCFGARARFTRDDGTAGASDDADLVRTSWEGLATASLPFSGETFVVAPMLGIGAAWTSTTPQLGNLSPESSDIGLRVEAAVTIGVQVSPAWSLTGEVGISTGRPSTARDNPDGGSIATPAGVFRAGVGCRYAR